MTPVGEFRLRPLSEGPKAIHLITCVLLKICAKKMRLIVRSTFVVAPLNSPASSCCPLAHWLHCRLMFYALLAPRSMRLLAFRVRDRVTPTEFLLISSTAHVSASVAERTYRML